MGYMIWQLVCFLLAFLGNSVLAFVTSQPFHHTGKSVTVVGLSLLLLLLESLENLRRRLTKATRIVHRPPPSTSRLLLLPPELRQQIWTMLFEDLVEESRCVHVRDSAPGLRTYADRLRLYIDINPNNSTMWFAIAEYPTRWSLLDYVFRHLSEWPPAFALSCRQIYNEAYYDLCNSTRFDFTEAKALVSWARTLTPARKRAVGEISMTMSNDSFNNPGIAPAMNQLSGLRKVIFFLYTEGSPDMTAVQAHHVWELVRSVKVSEILIVTLMEVTWDTDYDWVRYKWPAGSQEAFASAVLARISRPFSRVRHRVPLGTGNEATFVLRAKRSWD